MGDDDTESGVFIDEWTWQEICQRANLRCELCFELPWGDDVEAVVEDGVCNDCAAKWRKIFTDDD